MRVFSVRSLRLRGPHGARMPPSCAGLGRLAKGSNMRPFLESGEMAWRMNYSTSNDPMLGIWEDADALQIPSENLKIGGLVIEGEGVSVYFMFEPL